MEFAGTFIPRIWWLRRYSNTLDVVHFHWPEGIWRSSRRRPRGFESALQLRRMAALWMFLRQARKMRFRSMWTVHNLGAHESATRLDELGYRVLAAGCDLVICHSEWAAERLRSWLQPRREVVVMPIGNYDGVYPQPHGREMVLLNLGMDVAKPVVSCLGMIRAYKGIDVAVEAVKRLEGRVQLVIGGPLHPSCDCTELKLRVGNHPGIIVLPNVLSDQQFADLVSASDAILLPYARITGSSVLLTALTFGRPVIASDLPYFKEIRESEPDAIELVPPAEPEKLAEAIERLMGTSLDERRLAARRLAERYSWDRCVDPLAVKLKEWKDELDNQGRALGEAGRKAAV